MTTKNPNPAQQQAIEWTQSPLLIVAGAGSGKTMVITRKIAYLIAEKGFSPDSILAITFTNKAAREMRGRVFELVGPSAKAIQMSTFHAFGAEFLRSEITALGRNNQFVIYDQADQLQLMKSVLKQLKLDEQAIAPKEALFNIGLLKNSLLDPDTFARTETHPNYSKQLSLIYSHYQNALLLRNAVDFDDLLFLPVVLLQQNPDVLTKYQERFRYILVDEYQDINGVQYQLIRLLTGHNPHICVVGDFDQNIYSWRGANVRHILNFERDFPNTKKILLEQNYRSTQYILDAANGLIKHNQNRQSKNLFTAQGQGDPLTYFVAANEHEEAEFILNQVQKLMKDTRFSLSDVAILYRTNAQSRVLEEVCRSRSIRYHLIGGTRFYARKEIKDVLAYLRLVHTPHDNEAVIRAIGIPSRGIGQTSIDKLLALSTQHEKSIYSLYQTEELPLSASQKAQLKHFFELIERCANDYAHSKTEHPLETLIKQILDESGYRSMLNMEDSPESVDRLENVSELITIAREETGNLGDFLNQISLMTDHDANTDSGSALTLMTLHHAKGLEFPIVFICGIEEGVLPHYRSQFDRDTVEEERRLFYVGITRARSHLFLSSTNKRNLFGETWYNELSRFIAEVPRTTLVTQVAQSLAFSGEPILQKLKDIHLHYEVVRSDSAATTTQVQTGATLTIGDRVRHPLFGQGIVKHISGEHDKTMARISFGHETKELMLKYAPLEKL